jgi:hypothetical protein
MEDSVSRGDSSTELPFSVRLPSFVIAFLAAPLAGALAASAAAMAVALILVVLSAVWPDAPWRQDLHDRGLWDTGWSIIGVGLMTAFASFVASAAYTAVIGGLAVLYHRKTGNTPSLATGLVCGVLTGVLPCGAVALLVSSASEFAPPRGPGNVAVLVFFLSVVITATIATVWTFWRCGFADRVSNRNKVDSGLTTG